MAALKLRMIVEANLQPKLGAKKYILVLRSISGIRNILKASAEVQS